MKSLFFSLLISSILFGASSFLMPDEAFKPFANVNDTMQVEAGIDLAEDIYLYAEKLKIELKNTSAISIKNIELPQSVDHDGENAYVISPHFLIHLQSDGSLSGMQKINLSISYQGCSEKGLCYEPLTSTYELEIDTSLLSSADATNPSVQTNTQTDIELSETDLIADTIKNGSLIAVLLTFLGFGLLLSLTPCVFPMIPIISGVIISQGKDITTSKALMLSIVYVLAMAVAYTIAGVMAGLFGANIQAALQTPWVIYSFAGVFVALAFSMFGFYELKLPDSLVAKVSSAGSGGGYVGVAIMGFLSALIVGPCVAAPLAGALVYIGQTGDALLGGMALFSMSIGMGLPLIAVGVSAGKFMPRPGMWMTMVSAIFGVMMLAVAIWMLERVVDASIIMILYALLGLGFAIYLGALEAGSHVFKKTIAIVLFIYSLALFIGALAGSHSLTQPLGFLQAKAVASTTQTKATHLNFTKVTSIKELDKVLAANKGKKIMLDFYADWCTSCKELEEVTFVNSDVINELGSFVLIKADVTENSEDNKKLSKKYGVFGPPALIFFKEDGKVQSAKTVIGFIAADEFLQHLDTL
ncbi:MAG: protein-disulfide reductase DsbD [Sulfurimonas sp.]|nr:protein-disulfide reductase DsbD [Sulfurimonas sp.]